MSFSIRFAFSYSFSRGVEIGKKYPKNGEELRKEGTRFVANIDG